MAVGQMTWGRGLAWDEVEFVRATEWIRLGKVPFRDFWEHHAPLHWFVMAPFKALASGAGIQGVIAMRWAQIPLWILTFWGLSAWMAAAPLQRWSRRAGAAVLLACPMFFLWGLQYRVDVSAGMFLVLGLGALSKGRESRGWALGAGALLVAAGLANLRYVPVAGTAFLAASFMDLEGRRWRWQAWMPWVGAGALLVGAGALAYFTFSKSGGPAWQSLFIENAAADRLLARRGEGVGRMLSLAFDNGDLAGGLLLLIGGVGLARALWGLPKPGPLQFLALVQLVNLLFIHRMKAVYVYHFQLALLLLVPFVAEELERFWRQFRRPEVALGIVVGLVGVQTAFNVGNLAFSRESRTLAYQDRIMQEAHRATGPTDTVLDGCGWALHREPAYRYWFLALNVR
ncbi:MAG TPA: hypothetical protein VJ570_08085, partial [Holophagaceae bacterium]|nr:hypothetical protein [Holophagaceae bacterium]